jgi:hypothetical protein
VLAALALAPGYHLPPLRRFGNRLRRFGTVRAPPARTNNDVNFRDRTLALACTVEMITSAYDKVVYAGASDWLNVVRSHLVTNGAQNVAELKHLMVHPG